MLWLRRLNLFLHLWAGLVFTLYLIVIGLTGSMLVFRAELESLARPAVWKRLPAAPPYADPELVLSHLQQSFPRQRAISISAPTLGVPYFVSVLQGGGQRFNVASHPRSAETLGAPPRSPAWLSFVQDLHITLLLGRRGRVANGVGAAFLLLLNLTGLVIWWPGFKRRALPRWRRSLSVNFQRHWRRLNFDAHLAVGFWTLLISSFWALSGVYFGWPRQLFHWVDKLSPIVNAQPPKVPIVPSAEPHAFNLNSMLVQARASDPSATLAAINFPYSRRAPFEILMRRGQYTDTLYFNPSNGSHLYTWRYGDNRSMGDWIIWSQIPLHFGTSWGLTVKIVWCICGLALPLLGLTGVLMYWNRVLRHRQPNRNLTR